MGKTNNQSAFSNFISESVHVNGSISSSKDIMITGKVDGHLHVNGRVTVGIKSVINGDIFADSVEISGTVHGSVKCKEKLLVKASAVITGDLYTRLLQVEENAVLDGEIRMSDEITIREPARLNGFHKVAETG